MIKAKELLPCIYCGCSEIKIKTWGQDGPRCHCGPRCDCDENDLYDTEGVYNSAWCECQQCGARGPEIEFDGGAAFDTTKQENRASARATELWNRVSQQISHLEAEIEYLRKGLKVLVDKAEDPDAAQFADKLLHREVVL